MNCVEPFAPDRFVVHDGVGGTVLLGSVLDAAVGARRSEQRGDGHGEVEPRCRHGRVDARLANQVDPQRGRAHLHDEQGVARMLVAPRHGDDREVGFRQADRTANVDRPLNAELEAGGVDDREREGSQLADRVGVGLTLRCDSCSWLWRSSVLR